jgi:alpha-1,3-rhamnosyl/mannosyltransferase
MAHGVPVICSAAASLPEVSGGAALLVDPRDVPALALAMVHVHENEQLRAELRTAGLLHVIDFAPERTARAWRELHRELLAGTPS